MSKPEFCTTHEAARALSVTPRTIQLWCESGLLAHRKTSGGHRRIPWASVEQLLAEQGDMVPIKEGAAQRLRILVVEDEPALLRLYRIRLAAWPLNPLVTTVGNGFEALVRLGAERPDLLIADLHMPEWDGFKMLRTVRSISDLDHMEIVVVTGLDATAIADRGGLPEDVRVLAKPIPFGELENIAGQLAQVLGRAPGTD